MRGEEKGRGERREEREKEKEERCEQGKEEEMRRDCSFLPSRSSLLGCLAGGFEQYLPTALVPDDVGCSGAALPLLSYPFSFRTPLPLLPATVRYRTVIYAHPPRSSGSRITSRRRGYTKTDTPRHVEKRRKKASKQQVAGGFKTSGWRRREEEGGRSRGISEDKKGRKRGIGER